MGSNKRWELLQLPESGLDAFSILIDNILLDGLRCPCCYDYSQQRPNKD